MESKHFVNDKQLFETVKNYVSNPDADRPLLVIGHTGIGKTAIIKRAIDKCGEQVDFQTLNFGPAKEQHNKCLELVNAYDANANKHLIIELTCEFEGNFRTTIKKLGDRALWVYYREDVNDFLEWARDVNEDGYQNMDEFMCSFLEQKPESFSQLLNREKEALQKIWDNLDVATEHLQKDNVTDAIQVLQSSVKSLLIVTLDDGLLRDYIKQVLDILGEYKEKYPRQVMSFVMGVLAQIPFITSEEKETK